jgi:hypothetical protein
MRQYLGRKEVILGVGALSILVMGFLIASLGNLELQPARQFAYARPTSPLTPWQSPAWNWIGAVIVLFIAFVVLVVILLPREQRKKFIRNLVLVLLAGGMLFFLLAELMERSSPQPVGEATDSINMTRENEPTAIPVEVVTPAVFTPPGISRWQSTLVAFTSLLAIASAWAWIAWRRGRKNPPYNSLAEISENALQEINQGKDWGDAIINAYYRMNVAVSEWRGVHRRESMNPDEFARFLVDMSLPRKPVTILTSLFQQIRYGAKTAKAEDIQEAIDCLTEILEHCRRSP